MVDVCKTLSVAFFIPQPWVRSGVEALKRFGPATRLASTWRSLRIAALFNDIGKTTRTSVKRGKGFLNIVAEPSLPSSFTKQRPRNSCPFEASGDLGEIHLQPSQQRVWAAALHTQVYRSGRSPLAHAAVHVRRSCSPRDASAKSPMR